MIIIKIIGGLGNQMFQYAAGRRLAIKHDTTLKLDISGYSVGEGITPRDYELKVFNIQENFATAPEIQRFRKFDKSILKRISPALSEALRSKRYIKEKHYHFDPKILDLPDDVYMDGYWQSEKYFKNVENKIREEFSFKVKPQAQNQKLLKQIEKSSSVSLHIRRGDYVKNPAVKKILENLGLDYYQETVSMIAKKIANPHFFVFSDDIGWVKKHLNLKYPTVFIGHNKGPKSFEDLRLMSQCKHNIMANSSFSWWGAWLNEYPKKIVIAPKRWFADKRNTSDLIPDNWIKA